MLGTSRKHVNYDPCTRCSKPILNATGMCAECRRTNCRRCKASFIAKRPGISLCCDCTAARRSQAANLGEVDGG